MSRALAVVALLAFAAGWPLVQRGLVAHYDVNPWKLAGFAMYAAPVPPLAVVLFEGTDAGLAPIDEEQLDDGAQQLLRRFRIRRHALGQLASPEPALRAVLVSRPDLEWILMAIARSGLDPETGRIRTHEGKILLDRQATEPVRVRPSPP